MAPLILVIVVTLKIHSGLDSEGIDILNNVALGAVVLGFILIKFVSKFFNWYFDLILKKVFTFFGIDEP